MWFDSWSDIWRVLATMTAAYAAMILVLRSGGKRTLSKLNAYDFVVTIALGSILASVIVLKDVSVVEGIAAFGGLVLMQYLFTLLSNRWRSLRSTPRLLLSDGEFHDRALRDERVSRDEIEAAIRKDGHGRWRMSRRLSSSPMAR
jgi:uncharacterized membrane protein YcaP (DUF421 family)